MCGIYQIRNIVNNKVYIGRVLRLYVIFRCDCGRVLYTHKDNKTKKCPQCNKTLKIKQRRILGKSEDIETARAYVQELQNQIYHNTNFTTAYNIK